MKHLLSLIASSLALALALAATCLVPATVRYAVLPQRRTTGK